MTATEAPLLYTRGEAVIKLRMGRSKVDDLIRTGALRSVKIGRARRIPAAALDEFVARLLEKTPS